MKGWHHESYRHSLARKGVKCSHKMKAKRMSMAGMSVAYPGDSGSASHTETAPRFKNFMSGVMSDSANYMLDGSDGISKSNALSMSISDSYKDWLRPEGKVFRGSMEQESSTEDMIKGGVADNVPDDAFVEEQLEEGSKVEMEHTDNPNIAKEIAKDHLYETGKVSPKVSSDYYEKLKIVEGEGGY